MKSWDMRPIEIRNLFNPAFCGLVLARSLSGYEEEDARGMPYSLSLLVLPLCLHKDSREALQKGSRGYFLRVVSGHPELVINFGKRAADLLPYTQEALGFLLQVGSLGVNDDGRLRSVPKRTRKTLTGTPESIACQRVAKFLGKEFARIADRVTIYTTLGVRP